MQGEMARLRGVRVEAIACTVLRAVWLLASCHARLAMSDNLAVFHIVLGA